MHIGVFLLGQIHDIAIGRRKDGQGIFAEADWPQSHQDEEVELRSHHLRMNLGFKNIQFKSFQKLFHAMKESKV